MYLSFLHTDRGLLGPGRMRFWWVNQNQTFRQEISGGYLWSPKRNANGARNPFYESMREVSPGDLIFSFVDTRIVAIGIAKSYCWECPKPTEFGSTGDYWENIGWRVNVSFASLLNRIRPKDHIGILRSVLPDRYGFKAISIILQKEPGFTPLSSIEGMSSIEYIET